MPKLRPAGKLPGQLSFIPGEPPIAYCNRCGRRLKGEAAIERGYGPTCWIKRNEPFVSNRLENLIDYLAAQSY